MSASDHIGIIQFNPVVGALEANAQQILMRYQEAVKGGATLVVCSELAVTGYPPEDLVLRPSFRKETMRITQEIAAQTTDIPLIFGTIWEKRQAIYNSACVAVNGTIHSLVHKHDLPNYGVFDEKRLFTSAHPTAPIELNGKRIAVMICEDMWHTPISKHYQGNVDLIICLNASPVENKKPERRLQAAQRCIEDTAAPLIYVNQVGGQDELVFDGGSFILSANGSPLYQAPYWEETTAIHNISAPSLSPNIEYAPYHYTYMATVVGLRDYVQKNNFPGVVIGFSGGIDSALTAAIAVDALGSDAVKLVMMPSHYTSNESLDDANECAQRLGVSLDTIPITKAISAYEHMLADHFEGRPQDITEENIQSRIRGNTLMALSNKLNLMLLTTGNKSEMAVGYATLYGDMCGGFNALKDIYKTDVFALAQWRNTQSYVIPENIITKPPTAELRPDQKDEDSLPPYEQLDAILRLLIEERLSTESITQRGYSVETIQHVRSLLMRAEHKRRQAPPGVKITNLAFGRDRRYPITNRFIF